MTDDHSTTPNKHPHLYSSRFIDGFFQFPRGSCAAAVLKCSTLRSYGKVRRTGRGFRGGSHFSVFIAEDLVLWLGKRRHCNVQTHSEFQLTPDRLDSILQAELKRCPPSRNQCQYLLSNSPESIVWTSDFVYTTEDEHKPIKQSKGIRLMKYKRHPQSELFPSMTTEEFAGLVQSMKDHGFDKNFPIMTFEDQIVDGWHRYLAALKASVMPEFRVWRGTKSKLQAFVIYANSTRRHLSKAAHAAALIKARGNGLTMTDKEIAMVAGVSKQTVSEQVRLRRKNPKIADEVAQGRKKATHARRELGLPEKARPQYEGAMAFTLAMRLARRVRVAALEQTETPERFVIVACQERITRLKKKAAA